MVKTLKEARVYKGVIYLPGEEDKIPQDVASELEARGAFVKDVDTEKMKPVKHTKPIVK